MENDKIYIMNEICIPGMEYGVKTAEEICTKCGKLKKNCECDK